MPAALSARQLFSPAAWLQADRGAGKIHGTIRAECSNSAITGWPDAQVDRDVQVRTYRHLHGHHRDWAHTGHRSCDVGHSRAMIQGGMAGHCIYTRGGGGHVGPDPDRMPDSAPAEGTHPARCLTNFPPKTRQVGVAAPGQLGACFRTRRRS